ncbi:biotin-dependent carboxyltransferase family protein [Rufibacter sediminis]|uniref:Biotin-dependent carboxyltransferase family protein n=1 Tax=Rufibacter sediminis TaxID=2762756 RepID=A0ABR6VVP7_9BACT|nr:biotin-dependent carboxyltransferase family protein [Rufibacter sediminis]MBC3540893.1 biotin-dependent carboxyltransferase family protein [Rufibacter sediminis]
MSIKVEKAGLFTTVQDLGRFGFQKQGMVVSGAMDAYALRLANLLVNNPQNTAALEITLAGPCLLFQEDCLIALAGADLSPSLNGISVPIHRVIYVQKGALLAFGAPALGCRAYLSVAGGFDVPLVMGSAATYARAGLGGWQGRALQKGDVLPMKSLVSEQVSAWSGKSKPEELFSVASWGIAADLLSAYTDAPTVRVLPGPEYDLFSENAQETFWQGEFKIATASDRMGFRLEGPPLELKEPVELLSSAVTFGTVQVTPNGNPIILLAEHQTTGGYPRIGQVISADLPVLAQVRPGQCVRFREVSLAEAHALYYQQERTLEHLSRAIHLQSKR